MKRRSIVLVLSMLASLVATSVQTPYIALATPPRTPQVDADSHIPQPIPGDQNIAIRLDGALSPAARLSQLPNIRPLSDLAVGAPAQLNAAPAAVEHFIEDFEGDWNDPANTFWLHEDLSGADGGEFLWGKRDCAVIEGEFAAFTAGGGAKGSDRSCSSKYPKNARSSALAGYLDLRPYKSGTLSVFFKGQSEGFNEQACEATHDYFFFGMGPETPDNIRGRRHCGAFDDQWYVSTIDLATLPVKVLGSDNVIFQLYFFSDDDGLQANGFSIDYVDFALDRNVAPAPSGKIYVPIANKPVAVAPVIDCPDTEPNDAASLARRYTIYGSTCIGTLPTGDEQDFYSIDVGANQRVVIDLTKLGTNDYDLYLYNQGVAQVAKSVLNAGQNEHLEYVSPTAQQMYVQIVARSHVNPNNYSLTISRR